MSDRTYFSNDTIAANATAIGGAIAVLRVSGPDAFAIADRLRGGASRAPPRELFRTKLIDPVNKAALDDALEVRFPGPASFTGEDVVELHLHGGRYGVERVLSCLRALGARSALPGEFSFRAVRNGKLALTQAEAIQDLMEAASDGALSLALEKLSGSQAKLLQSLSEKLRTLAALGELGIDFSDQDVEEVSLPSLRARASEVLQELSSLRDSFGRGARIRDGVRTAILGLPNAGKSSLFNALLGEERAIVTEIPGTTRDVVSERLSLSHDGKSSCFRLEDTAGLRESKDRVESIGIERAVAAAKNAELVLFVVDPGASFQESSVAWKKAAVSPEISIGVLTHRDLRESKEIQTAEEGLRGLGFLSVISVSSLNGTGIQELAREMIRRGEKLTERASGEVLLTRESHLEAVTGAILALERANSAQELDLFSADLRQALHFMSPLIGETLPDDILGKVFSQFCIGK